MFGNATNPGTEQEYYSVILILADYSPRIFILYSRKEQSFFILLEHHSFILAGNIYSSFCKNNHSFHSWNINSLFCTVHSLFFILVNESFFHSLNPLFFILIILPEYLFFILGNPFILYSFILYSFILFILYSNFSFHLFSARSIGCAEYILYSAMNIIPLFFILGKNNYSLFFREYLFFILGSPFILYSFILYSRHSIYSGRISFFHSRKSHYSLFYYSLFFQEFILISDARISFLYSLFCQEYLFFILGNPFILYSFILYSSRNPLFFPEPSPILHPFQ